VPEGVRYLSSELPQLRPTLTVEEQIAELHRMTSDRFKVMYVEEGAGGRGTGSGSGADGEIFLIPVPITGNITITEEYLANIDEIAAGNHPIYVAVIQDDSTGGHLVRWDATDFHGPSTTNINTPSGEWSVDDGPDRVTVYHFARHPVDLKWWLVSWISYDAPEEE
jgi:hypothetical protein